MMHPIIKVSPGALNKFLKKHTSSIAIKINENILSPSSYFSKTKQYLS